MSSVTLTDGTRTEVVHSRTSVCKKLTRKGNVTVIDFADVDRAAIEKVFPFESYTVADFPELFVDHVGRLIPQGVGTVVKMPMTWTHKSGGLWNYSGPKNASNTLLAVYRGTQAGQGTLVDPSEYVPNLIVGASTGVKVDGITFFREQSDTDGRPFIIEADFLLSGTRTGPAEIARILGLYGITVDGTFAAASALDVAAGFFVDAMYGGDVNGRTGSAIIQDLLAVARGYIVQSETSAWSLVQDVAKSSTAQYDESADLVDINSYGDGDISKTVTLAYRPSASGGTTYTGNLSRVTNGQAGEQAMKNPYVRAHSVADLLLSYWQKRLNSLRIATASMYAVQTVSGNRITLTSYSTWRGAKDFIATGVARPGDKNDLTLREYDATIYVYSAPGPLDTPLPADATNVYAPDLSYTQPLAPTGVAVLAQGSLADTDGKVTSYATVTATPPLVNWTRLMALIQDNVTGEVYPAQLLLNGGVYKATISGIRPNRACTLITWAVNSNGLDGITSTPVALTSANSSLLPTAPASASIAQTQSFQLVYSWTKVADIAGQAQVRGYIVEESVSSGAYAEVYRGDAVTFVRDGVSTSSTYQIRVTTYDGNQNLSSTATASAVVTPVKKVDGTYIVDSSINQGRSFTGTGSASVTIIASSSQSVDMDVYTFFPDLDHGANATGAAVQTSGTKSGAADQGRLTLKNNNAGSSTSVTVTWRNFQA